MAIHKQSLESSDNAQKVESLESKNLDSSVRVESMDCHATATALARNDKNSNAPDCRALPNDNARNDSPRI